MTEQRLVLGEMDPALAINIVRALVDTDYLIITESVSSYLYYFSRLGPANIAFLGIAKGTSKVDLPTVARYYELNYKMKQRTFNSLASHIESKLEQLVRPSSDSVIFWNYGSIINNWLYRNCKQKNIIENGLVRPGKITFDYFGLNKDGCGTNLTLTPLRVRGKFRSKRQFELDSPRHYRWFRVFDFILRFSSGNRQRLELSSKYFSRIERCENHHGCPLYEKFVFLPLQIMTDTQIIFYSEFRSVNEIFEKASIDPDVKKIGVVIFKKHPLDRANIVESEFILNGVLFKSTAIDTRELITNSSFILTVNSTVGFESLLQGKKVKLLGRAAYEALCRNPVSQQELESFITRTQLDFNINDYSQKDVCRLISRLR